MKPRLYDAFDDLRPDQAARERMLQNILNQASDLPPAGKDVTMKPYLKKSLLIAAVLTLALTLMGCAVVLMRLSDLRIAEETYTENAHYERDGSKVPAQEKSRTVTSLQGITGSKNQQAAQEWYEFTKSYDPNLEKIEENYLAPEEYQAYRVYNEEMLQKVKALCEKYDLLPAGRQVLIQHYQSDVFLDLIGAESLLKPGKAETADYYGGTLYACGNFDISVEMELSGEQHQWKRPVWFSIRYYDKAYFDAVTVHLDSDAKQWNYTLSDGTDVLIVKVDNCAWVFCDREDAFLSARIETLFYGAASEPETMSDRDIELVTECIDFTLKPRKPDFTGVEEKLEASEKAYRQEQEKIRSTMPQEDHFSHDSYADLLNYIPAHKETFSWVLRREYDDFPENIQYVLKDVTGDGEAELLLGQNGNIITVWRMLNGKTSYWLCSDDVYLCEGDVFEQAIFRDGQPQHDYFRLGPEEEAENLCWVGYIAPRESWVLATYSNGHEERNISEEEAMEIIASYTRLELDWKPVSEFPGN